MTVGEALADARGAAGLSVDEVSERTRIRETVIRSIEQDDFDALGGDLYVRGYLRAIAGAVGVDPRPLIREFDAVRAGGPSDWAAMASSQPAVASEPAAAESPAAESAAAGLAVAEPAAAGPADRSESLEPTVTVEAIVAADVPAVADVGVALPAIVHPPAVVDQPETRADLAITGRPFVEDYPTLVDQPIVEDYPTLVDQPIVEDYPTLVDQPVIFDHPTLVDSFSSPPWNSISWDSDFVASQRARPGEALASDDYPPFWAGDAVSDADPVSAMQSAFAKPTIAGAPATPARRSKPKDPARPRSGPSRRSRVRGWRWATVISTLVIVVLGIVGVASGQIVAKLQHITAHPSTTATGAPTVAAQTPVAAPSPTPAPAPATPAPSPSPSPAPAPVRQLTVRSVFAFGPGGTADGDHPERAWNVIAKGATLPWETDWYATAKFGMLKSGTGLLLDMGRPVTITSLQVRLSSTPGASLQIRVGNQPVISEMPTVVSAQHAGGLRTMWLTRPTPARYVIIWFTRLPPIGAGQYRECVYSVTVAGRP